MTATIISAVAIVAAIIYAWWSNRTPPDDGFKQGKNDPSLPWPFGRPGGRTTPNKPSSETRGFVRPQRPPSTPDKY